MDDEDRAFRAMRDRTQHDPEQEAEMQISSGWVVIIIVAVVAIILLLAIMR